MKIQADTQHPAQVQQAISKGDSQAAAGKERTGKPQQKTDLVQLSSGVESQRTGELEELQTRRVEEIKAKVAAGTYRVDSRLVAEKMLSADSGL